ncbi:sugar ABC transporter substrate-binding protein [Bauldia sp.]|uniref:sugar ABC transporter substrate-binding protein n=1 Tax=Bauldia sp. TaxID=2575872 RepID=UPI003BA94A7B
MTRRKIGLLATAGICALGTIASAQAEDAVDVTIGWVPPDVTGVFATATSFFEASAAEANKNGFNVEVITRSPATHTAFADQVGIVEDLISRQVDVIAISPTEVEIVRPALRQAAERGIPVIVVNLLEPIPDVDVVSYIGFDNVQGAKVTAYAILDYFGGPGVLGEGEKVDIEDGQFLDLAFWEDLYGGLTDEQKAKISATGAIIEGIAGGFFSTARLNGFNEVMADYPNINIVGATCAADWNRELGTKCTEDFMQSNPEGLDFIWAASNEMGLGAMLALQAADRLETAENGPSLGNTNVAVFTNDVTPESVERIAEGRLIAETTHGFADWGWYGTAFGVQTACGLDIPATFDIRPRIAYADNAREFYPDPALPEIDWATIRADCQMAQ